MDYYFTTAQHKTLVNILEAIKETENILRETGLDGVELIDIGYSYKRVSFRYRTSVGYTTAAVYCSSKGGVELHTDDGRIFTLGTDENVGCEETPFGLSKDQCGKFVLIAEKVSEIESLVNSLGFQFVLVRSLLMTNLDVEGVEMRCAKMAFGFSPDGVTSWEVTATLDYSLYINIRQSYVDFYNGRSYFVSPFTWKERFSR